MPRRSSRGRRRDRASSPACRRRSVALRRFPIVDVRRLIEGPVTHPRWPAADAAERVTGCAWGVATSGSTGGRKTVLLTDASVAHVTDAVQGIVGYRPCNQIHGGSHSATPLVSALARDDFRSLPRSADRRAHREGAVALDRRGNRPSDDFVEAPVAPRRRLPSGRSRTLVTLAGQGTNAETRTRFAAAAGGARFVSFYGLTEATTRVLWSDHDEFFGDARTTGRPIRGVRASNGTPKASSGSTARMSRPGLRRRPRRHERPLPGRQAPHGRLLRRRRRRLLLSRASRRRVQTPR